MKEVIFGGSIGLPTLHCPTIRRLRIIKTVANLTALPSS